MTSKDWKKKAAAALFAGSPAIVPYYLTVYWLLIATLGLFIVHVSAWDAITVLIIAASMICYPFFYMVPGMAFGAVFSLATKRAGDTPWRRRTTVCIACGLMYLTHLLLLMDAGLFHGFGFHFNFLVWNLLTTPGGFASMGLRAGTVWSLVGGMALLLVFHIVLMALFARQPKLRKVSAAVGSWRKYAVAGTIVFAFFFSLFAYGYEHFMLRSTALDATGTIPLFRPMTMSGLMTTVGFTKPDREVVQIKADLGKFKTLNYPAAPIRRTPERPKYNVVWLSCESWRADMLTPEIMPESSRFAAGAINFKNNYSGGNGTRQGMFTMFYGLYGNYWSEFLKNRRGPLLMDWMVEDGYRFRCVTSAKFTYPEFDQTIFLRVPQADMHSDDEGLTYTRDQRNVKLLTEFIREADPAKPFMAFMFFESPHAPYEFPPEAVIRTDYATDLNYAKVSNIDGTAIKNRYINANRHLDMRLAEVFAALEEKKLLDRTIVVLAGDHGEEFYEKGRLGHNSTFVEEQIRTPLVIRIPGVAPREYTGISSHLDIVPMLAPYFGVTNPPDDFSLGFNLLDPAVKRDYLIAADWSRIAYISRAYKTILPANSIAFATQKLTDGNDRPLPNLDEFYNQKKTELFQIQRDLTRFSR